MAYVDKQPLSRRLANLGTTELIELGIGVALVAGLSTTFVVQNQVPQNRCHQHSRRSAAAPLPPEPQQAQA